MAVVAVSYNALCLYLQVAGVLTAGYGPDVLHSDAYGEDIKTTAASGGLSRSMRASAKEQLAAVIVLAQAVPSAPASGSTRAAADSRDRGRGPAGRSGGQWAASEFASEGKGASSDDEDTAFGINSFSGPGRGLSAADLIPDLTAALMASQRS